ncbi:hypothetical protein KM800_13520 [Clostridium tyrobutyricum]|uniref:hypothetical protein n=1 Tax=Clostridium tyrobutyricum TaxID=1519 RepID=UPI001C3871F6|nr:hypothetical protein [Clostridium tyrobutyricum]MBV4420325.1 hypothetical protein [Clostridium tyrobutyricum]
MNDINIAAITTAVGLLCTMVGTFVGYKSFKNDTERNSKQEVREDAKGDTQLKMQLDYISRGVDDIKLDIKDQNRKISSLIERVARIEESVKSAHHRIDDLEDKI